MRATGPVWSMLQRVTVEEETLRPPRSRAVGYIGIVVGVLYTLGLLAFVFLREDGWAMSPLLLLGVFLVIHGRTVLVTRVEVTSRGLAVVDLRRPRGRFVPWETIEGARVDPPGGSRQVHLRLREEPEVSLPALPDADNDVVLAAVRTSQAEERS